MLKIEENDRVSPRKIITTTITEEYRRIQRKIIEEFDEGLRTAASNAEACRDSGYSSNQERSNTQQTLVPSVSVNDHSPYELLSECYSGYAYIRSDFLIPTKSPLISNVSSLQSTTDEAYESEPTTRSPRSPTMSSSTVATTNHIHPDLEHEFDFPSPPPPVPDRRLKPAHLRPPPPPTKPRTNRQQKKDSTIHSQTKTNRTLPLAVIQHLITSTSNDATLSTTRALSSRHYCGSLPLSSEVITSSADSPASIQTDEVAKQNSKTFSNSNSSTNNDNNQPIVFTKSSLSSLNLIKPKKTSTCFDETTNGLAVRLPVPASDQHDSTSTRNLHRISTASSSSKQVEGSTKTRPVSDNLNSNRSSVYETSV